MVYYNEYLNILGINYNNSILINLEDKSINYVINDNWILIGKFN